MNNAVGMHGIFSMLYENNNLYVGCVGGIAAWNLNIQSNVCNYSGQRDFPEKDNPSNVLGLAIDSDMLFYASSAGAVGGLTISGGYASCGTYYEKEVKQLDLILVEHYCNGSNNRFTRNKGNSSWYIKRKR